MLQSAKGLNGCFSAPHTAAALAGQAILAKGGTAIEAMVAAAAAIAVVYPHMNGIGGDGFWLIARPGEPPIAISGCGRAAERATPEWFANHGHTAAIPTRGPHAALTVPGTISSWQLALEQVAPDRRLPLSELLASAIALAERGMVVTGNQAACTTAKLDGLKDVPGFAETFLIDGAPPREGDVLRQPALARTLQALVSDGLDSFYRGPIADAHAAYLEALGSPLQRSDFQRFAAEMVEPLSVSLSAGQVFNLPPPTQGVASLMILALFDRLKVAEGEGFDHVHGLVEATKQAFLLRNAGLGDPDVMDEPANTWLTPERLDALAGRIDRNKAMSWPVVAKPGDTVWMGAADAQGTVVSFIQSVFWEFGSGVICPQTGVSFQNRGAGFSLAPGPNQVGPGRRPFHTLNPALARMNDGRVMAYGTMGGEGQPQTQAAFFSRYALFGLGLQQAVTAPRWLLGKTWGDQTTTLKLENRFPPSLIDALRAAGHALETIPAFSDMAGHAGAVIRHPSGVLEGASDPRADGAALAF
ncbi:gamma-glutamyltransferase family protein [Jiella sp. MQZ9-1]|uniref:Gamma-glutamyltransferase family protein n=1 Tax=Jiella flava TaxID=2816857 RepID=A0A939FUK9_9HYPH|nr:gamma-glutamyltransferase family protein [Jiella flava]MBO0661104.1 gamma-glutamyltransferase family protein [Jiella flava]MCD2469751.1 gamma-glutamyltransferase family protein [Jiella flava]